MAPKSYAHRAPAAEKEGRYIAVEIKSFLGSSALTEFHAALGQFLNYRLGLETKAPLRTLYLAVPVDTHSTFFALPFTQAAVKRHAINIIVYDPETEEIVQWIP